MYLVLLTTFLFALLFVYLFLSHHFSGKKIRLNGSHVLITGGSSGIGKAMAIEAVKQGANVTILARNTVKLAEAKGTIEQHFIHNEQHVVCVSVNLAKDFVAVEKAIQQATNILGPVTLLVNCAGFAMTGTFEDIPIDDFKKQMDANYISSVFATRAVVGAMKQQNAGCIVFLSSIAGQFGIFGYTAYSASKFALRGLAEALQMEVKPYNISITLAFPPDTDTPGFALENKTKSKETKLISDCAGLYRPDYVAKKILDDTVRKKFFSSVGLDGHMVSNLTSGMSPVTSYMEAFQQIICMGLFRAIALFYIHSFGKIVQNCHKEKLAAQFSNHEKNAQ